MPPILRPRTATLIGKILRPLIDTDVITIAEYRELLAQLKHLSTKGTLVPVVVPRLITQQEVSDMLGISLANMKKLERESAFGFKRKRLGSAVRYRNVEVINWLLSEDAPETEAQPEPTEIGTE
jgi:predicted DNA-binding transcriptional regulator AlpA